MYYSIYKSVVTYHDCCFLAGEKDAQKKHKKEKKKKKKEKKSKKKVRSQSASPGRKALKLPQTDQQVSEHNRDASPSAHVKSELPEEATKHLTYRKKDDRIMKAEDRRRELNSADSLHQHRQRHSPQGHDRNFNDHYISRRFPAVDVEKSLPQKADREGRSVRAKVERRSGKLSSENQVKEIARLHDGRENDSDVPRKSRVMKSNRDRQHGSPDCKDGWQNRHRSLGASSDDNDRNWTQNVKSTRVDDRGRDCHQYQSPDNARMTEHSDRKRTDSGAHKLKYHSAR